MNIYLAGGITGNLNLFWKEAMNIYLAGTYSRKYVIEKAMNIYLAGNAPWKEAGLYDKVLKEERPHILESFYYLRDNKNNHVIKMMEFYSSFMLDSGAFTFMMDKKGVEADWDKYIDDYSAFIKTHNIDLFFELDIDAVVGIERVEKLRTRLEKITQKQCIPVWHKSRGLDYWEKMTKEYNYVAIGGIVSKEIRPQHYPVFNTLLKIANKNKCKVHALGFTRIDDLKKYNFYSVDSTAWLYGNRGGFLYLHNMGRMEKFTSEKRLNGKEGALHNFVEWLKFSKYMKNYKHYE